MSVKTRPGAKYVHRFRSQVLNMTVFKGRLLVATERGVYLQDKNGKRFRRVKVLASVSNNVPTSLKGW